LPSSACATVDSQRIVMPSSSASSSGVVGRHPLAGPPVHHDGLGRAEPARGARGVHGRVPAAVDGDPPAQHGFRAVLHAVQHRHRVHDPGGVAGRDVGAPADVGADGHEGGVEAASCFRVAAGGLVELGEDVGDLGVELQGGAHVQDAVQLGVEDVARQPVLRYAVAHHPAGCGTRVLDRHRVT